MDNIKNKAKAHANSIVMEAVKMHNGLNSLDSLHNGLGASIYYELGIINVKDINSETHEKIVGQLAKAVEKAWNADYRATFSYEIRVQVEMTTISGVETETVMEKFNETHSLSGLPLR